MRMTLTTQLVLRALLVEPQVGRYGIEIGDATRLPSGTVHPILARLERAGWAQSEWEDVDPGGAGRPARRYYRLTAEGVERAREALARAYRGRRARGVPSPARGLS